MSTSQSANEHDAEDCEVTCPHPDHAYDGPIPDLWRLLLGDSAERTYEAEMASQGFVSL